MDDKKVVLSSKTFPIQIKNIYVYRYILYKIPLRFLQGGGGGRRSLKNWSDATFLLFTEFSRAQRLEVSASGKSKVALASVGFYF